MKTICNTIWGWRGRVGLIMPAVQTVTEPLYNSIAPMGVSFHTSRLHGTGEGLGRIAKMEELVPRAVDELAQSRVNCIAYMCVAGGLIRGIDREKRFCEEIEERTGIPVISALLSTFEALNVLKIRQIVITGPYTDDFNELERKLFESNGFEVLGSYGLGIKDGFDFAQVEPMDIYSFSKRVWEPSADGLFIACANFNAMPIIELLETDLKVPVITAHSAVFWKILKTLGIKESLRGFGELLSEHT
ncbi:maleate cis-trans isomerase [Chloroflexota bacterium]